MNSIRFYSQNSFIVQAFSLDHFSMMNSNSQKHGVHHLTQEELDDMIIETFSQDDDSNEPCEHVHGVGQNVML